MKLTLLSKNEFHHDQCMLYRLNNASQSSRWLLVEDFWLWLLLVSVVAWLVRCWLEPGRGQQTAVRGEWPGPICHLVTTEVITGLRALWWPQTSPSPETMVINWQWSSSSQTHWVLSLLGLRGSWPSLHWRQDDTKLSFRSQPQQSEPGLSSLFLPDTADFN